ncbi:DivIVA domain-containing protein [Vaginisenegalia massiliensis]|uniref:DivIVA domain-containing protein n=1 Tax=Vaginisenegalia massiliensis TaxID=2058294 RepID=UPI000F546398|nr:DivIVA domain-containing protein [Vaginisenegalia massiliensis]
MALTPIEILNKEFDTKFRGYDSDQVNDYLDVIVADMESAEQERQALEQRLQDAQDKVRYFEQLQDSLNNSIVVAQDAAERLKQNARKEAELIIYEAEQEANRIISQAADRSSQLVTETQALRQSTKSFRDKIQQMFQEQLAMISSHEFDRIFAEHEAVHAQSESVLEESEKLRSQRIDQLEQEAVEEAENNLVQSSDSSVEYPQTQVVEYEEDNQDLPVESLAAVSIDQPQAIEEDPFIPVDQPERQPEMESVLGQTIRIELPKD